MSETSKLIHVFILIDKILLSFLVYILNEVLGGL